MAETAHYTETYKSLITLSVEGFKFCALANGGAAVALLAYLGNIAGKGASTPDMRLPMAWFLAGLVLCGIAMFSAYLTQLFLFRESRDGALPGLMNGSEPTQSLRQEIKSSFFEEFDRCMQKRGADD